MLIDFAIKNFRSIKEKQIFSMLPRETVKELESNVCNDEGDKLLKTSIIYGRNGSGKSNLLTAFHALSYLIKESNDFKLKAKIDPYEPYKLDLDCQKKPVEFEINFIAKDGLRYNYFISYDLNEIIKEALYYYPSTKPAKIFIREKGKNIENGTLLGNKYKEIEKTLYPNQLFLSKVGTSKIDALIIPYTFLTKHFSINTVHDSGYDEMLIRSLTQLMVNAKNTSFKENINKLLRASDTGIKGVTVKEHSEKDFKFPKSIPDEIKKKLLNDVKYQVQTLHDLYKDGNVVSQIEFNIEEESTGTKKLMAFGGLIIDSLNNGDVVIVDELDKSLHPILTKALINVFNNKKTNPRNAQLIIASHDVSLLSNSIFRRDQIWISEKNEEGMSSYYSISDVQDVRKNVPFERWYLAGKFNGIPIINEYNLDFTFE